MRQEKIDKELSFVDLLRGFIEYAAEKGVKSFPIISPLFTDPLWHKFFYEFKKEFKEKFPVLGDCIGGTDWDAPYPVIRALDDIKDFSPLIFFLNFHSHRLFLKIKQEKNLLLLNYPEMAKKMLAFADQIPGFLEWRDF